jgi:hypothetical protein
VVLIDHFPVRPIWELLVNFGQFFAFERRHSAPAWNTGFGFKGWHRSLSRPPKDGSRGEADDVFQLEQRTRTATDFIRTGYPRR